MNLPFAAGITMLASPFLAAAVISVKTMGWKAALVMWTLVAGFVVFVGVGSLLLVKGLQS